MIAGNPDMENKVRIDMEKIMSKLNSMEGGFQENPRIGPQEKIIVSHLD